MQSQTDIEPQQIAQSEPLPTPPVVDNKSIVTPYAFGVSDDLLNRPLASPTRRLCAMLIDLFFVAIMSSLNALFLAGFAALTFLRTNIRLARERRFRRTRIALSVVITLLLFFIVYGVIELFNETDETPGDSSITGVQAIATGGLYAAWYGCDDFDCKAGLIDSFVELYADSNIAEEQLLEGFNQILINDPTLDSAQREQLVEQAKDKFSASRAMLTTDSINQTELIDALPTLEEQTPSDVVQSAAPDDDSVVYSLIHWTQGIIEDLGLGFGWAALYFSAFTTMWRGATPGKRICGIYVVRLDGRIPTLWESFGRYGGYGAGLATGLSGFLQIYWDPNRQAIQDKISETLVLRRHPEPINQLK